jgi:hypothetical protein
MDTEPEDGGLPNWAEPPADLPAAVATVKAAIRARIESSGRTVEDIFAQLEALVAERTPEIHAANEESGSAWPEIDFEDIAAETVSPETRALVRRRGCVVIRGHFEHERALRWDQEILAYVEDNGFFDVYTKDPHSFFMSVDSKPEILPIYWSGPQMEARQSERMAHVQRFLNGFWTSTPQPGSVPFDPNRSAMYPDRIRRRPEGVDSLGLHSHIDSGTLDLWMKSEYQRAFRHVFGGAIEEFDPWDAAHRTDGSQYPGSTFTSVFRTFQGWTALCDMDHDQGVLHSVPIPEAIAYLLLRPLLVDVADGDMCGVTVNRSFVVDERWHAPLLEAASGIPDVRAGDSVWWHGDMVHSVAPVTNQRGWGNVMYIPAAPWCPRNARYAASVLDAFRTGSSPGDFPEEHYEQSWPDRFRVDALNGNGRLSLGLPSAGAVT